MKTLKVPDTLSSKYRGPGVALIATLRGQVVDLVYLEDDSPSYSEMLDQPGADAHLAFFARQVLGLPELAPTVRRLQAMGEVSVGVLSGWEFTEL